jgi:hypothetical protein
MYIGTGDEDEGGAQFNSQQALSTFLFESSFKILLIFFINTLGSINMY